jgi:hypothetical protein
MRIMAYKALAALIRPMLDGIFRGLVAHHAKIAARGYRRDGGLTLLRGSLVAVLTTHPHSRVNELALFSLGMASEAGLRLYVLLFDERMLRILLSWATLTYVEGNERR